LSDLEEKVGAVVLSCKYAEMKLTNLAGAKQALEDFGTLA
jgi:hypothetical protein